MKSRIEVAVGQEYGGLNRGYIYEVIHKMERDGLITSRVEPQAGPRPDRTVHEITEAGREQLTGWLGEPARPSAGFRDEFVQKVLAASMRGTDELRRFCRLQRQALLAESKTLQTLRRERADDPAAAFTIEVAILRTNAELECVEAAEARAGQRLVDLVDPAEQAPRHQPQTDSRTLAARRRAGGRAGLPSPSYCHARIPSRGPADDDADADRGGPGILGRKTGKGCLGVCPDIPGPGRHQARLEGRQTGLVDGSKARSEGPSAPHRSVVLELSGAKP